MSAENPSVNLETAEGVVGYDRVRTIKCKEDGSTWLLVRIDREGAISEFQIGKGSVTDFEPITTPFAIEQIGLARRALVDVAAQHSQTLKRAAMVERRANAQKQRTERREELRALAAAQKEKERAERARIAEEKRRQEIATAVEQNETWGAF